MVLGVCIDSFGRKIHSKIANKHQTCKWNTLGRTISTLSIRPTDTCAIAFSIECGRSEEITTTMFLRKVATKLGNPFTRLQAIRRYGYPAHAKSPKQVIEETKAGMDYLPVPEGSWQAAYQAKVSKGNQQMILAAVAFAVSVAVAWKTNTLYLHGPPDYKSVKVEVPYYKGEIIYRVEGSED